MEKHFCPHCESEMTWQYTNEPFPRLAFYCENCDGWVTLDTLRYYSPSKFWPGDLDWSQGASNA